MSFLPDIDEEGKLKDTPAVSQLYTPPGSGRRIERSDIDGFHKDTAGTHLKDAPTMNNIHECVPNEHHECITCRREMLV